jgi:hypothetical protein
LTPFGRYATEKSQRRSGSRSARGRVVEIDRRLARDQILARRWKLKLGDGRYG